MSTNIYSAGLRNVGSYQVSGHPYFSGSATTATFGESIRFSFPYVTKKITLKNSDSANAAIVSFAPFLEGEASGFGYSNYASGSGTWLYLPAGFEINLDVKCKEVYVSSHLHGAAVDAVYIVAELTTIPNSRLYSFDGLRGITNE